MNKIRYIYCHMWQRFWQCHICHSSHLNGENVTFLRIRKKFFFANDVWHFNKQALYKYRKAVWPKFLDLTHFRSFLSLPVLTRMTFWSEVTFKQDWRTLAKWIFLVFGIFYTENVIFIGQFRPKLHFSGYFSPKILIFDWIFSVFGKFLDSTFVVHFWPHQVNFDFLEHVEKDMEGLRQLDQMEHTKII